MELPSFGHNGRDSKLTRLEKGAEPRRSICAWLAQASAGRDPASLRVLDVGCGRGDTVAWLLERGLDAYGLDVRPEYLANGVGCVGQERLSLLVDSTYPYPDSYFDIVLSDQVFEHVQDPSTFASEVARTTKPGGVGLHLFPAKWRIIEPHLGAPGPLDAEGAEYAKVPLGWRLGQAWPRHILLTGRYTSGHPKSGDYWRLRDYRSTSEAFPWHN